MHNGMKVIAFGRALYGSVEDHSVSVLYNGEEAKTIAFGRAFFGQRIKRTLKLVNKAPAKRMFVLQIPKDRSDERASNKPLFEISPLEGEIEANSTKEITVNFLAPLQRLNDDTEVFYNHETRLDILKTPISIPLCFEASTVQMQISINCLDFVYGNVIVDSTTVKPLILENTSKFKDITYSIKEVAHFHFKPLKGSIKKGSHKTIFFLYR